MKNLLVVTVMCSMLVLSAGIYAAQETKTEEGEKITEKEILLDPNFENILKIGEYAWFTEEENAGSTGYSWQAYVDNSGVYELVKIVSAYPHVPIGVTGAPGRIAWKIKAINEGKGAIKFELIRPGKKHEKVKDITVKLVVKK
jgi:predicted secreted protein